MSFSGSDWRMWRDAPGFRQRFEGTISQDGNTVTARWGKCTDGAEREHDFDVTHRKVPSGE